MTNSIEEEIKDTELFMLAQFIDVLEVLEKMNTIKEVKEDIKKRKNIYLQLIEGKGINKDFFSLSIGTQNIEEKIKKAKEINTLDKQDEVYLAYKLGLIDGLKVKNKE